MKPNLVIRRAVCLTIALGIVVPTAARSQETDQLEEVVITAIVDAAARAAAHKSAVAAIAMESTEEESGSDSDGGGKGKGKGKNKPAAAPLLPLGPPVPDLATPACTPTAPPADAPCWCFAQAQTAARSGAAARFSKAMVLANAAGVQRSSIM